MRVLVGMPLNIVSDAGRRRVLYERTDKAIVRPDAFVVWLLSMLRAEFLCLFYTP